MDLVHTRETWTKAIWEAPCEATVRLSYADWLEGEAFAEEERAAFYDGEKELETLARVAELRAESALQKVIALPKDVPTRVAYVEALHKVANGDSGSVAAHKANFIWASTALELLPKYAEMHQFRDPDKYLIRLEDLPEEMRQQEPTAIILRQKSLLTPSVLQGWQTIGSWGRWLLDIFNKSRIEISSVGVAYNECILTGVGERFTGVRLNHRSNWSENIHLSWEKGLPSRIEVINWGDWARNWKSIVTNLPISCVGLKRPPRIVNSGLDDRGWYMLHLEGCTDEYGPSFGVHSREFEMWKGKGKGLSSLMIYAVKEMLKQKWPGIEWPDKTYSISEIEMI